MKRKKTRLSSLPAAVMLVSVLVAGASGAPGAELQRDTSLLLEGKASVRRGLRFLAEQQKENGSWQDHPAITGLVVTAMVGSGQEDFGPGSPVVSRALEYIRSHAKPDGGIYDRFYASYSTSICAMALVEAGLPEDRDLISGARGYLLGAQADESEDIDPDNVQYGGWGYEAHASGEGMHRADMSNTQFALEALHIMEGVAPEDVPEGEESSRTRTELAYGRAVEFLERCQNLKEYNDQEWASNDGGFVYRPGESKAGSTPQGGLRSYAGMTYAGLKSMIYAELDHNDPRVRAAYDWARQHWTLKENPGLGQQGLYYYYMVLTRALNAYGVEIVVDAEGQGHDWRRELINHLLEVQNADGSWVNSNGRWMETMPELVTAYAALAIEQAAAGW